MQEYECGEQHLEQCFFSEVSEKLPWLSDGVCREAFLSRGRLCVSDSCSESLPVVRKGKLANSQELI